MHNLCEGYCTAHCVKVKFAILLLSEFESMRFTLFDMVVKDKRCVSEYLFCCDHLFLSFTTLLLLLMIFLFYIFLTCLMCVFDDFPLCIYYLLIGDRNLVNILQNLFQCGGDTTKISVSKSEV